VTTRWTSDPPAQIDTLGLSWPVEPEFHSIGGRVSIRNFGEPGEATTVSHALPGGGFLALGIGGKAWGEASLPKRLDGSNVSALSVPDALEVARGLYREARGFCEPRDDGKRFELCEIVRLDAVRDFDGVHHAPELLNGLAAVPRSTTQKVRRWADAERNRAETLRVGPKAWGSTLYDKHAESPRDAEPGRVRYEGRFHREQLASEWARKHRFVMRVIADIEEDKVQALTRTSFERVAFDREVVGRASVAEAVFGCERLSRRMQVELWCFLTAPGFNDKRSRTTVAKYRRLAAELGVTVAAAEEESADVMVRLDFEAGSEVLRVA
jgi:hypothetical protein